MGKRDEDMNRKKTANTHERNKNRETVRSNLHVRLGRCETNNDETRQKIMDDVLLQCGSMTAITRIRNDNSEAFVKGREV